MFGYIAETIYYYSGYTSEIKPSDKTIRSRNEMLKQIKKSKLKLNPIHYENELCVQLIDSNGFITEGIDTSKCCINDVYDEYDHDVVLNTTKTVTFVNPYGYI